MFDPTFIGPMLSMRKRTSILVVDDDLSLKPQIERIANSLDPEILLTWATNLEEAKDRLSEFSHGLIISDYLLSENETGLDLWKICRERFRAVPFILFSGLTVKSIERLIADQEELPLLIHKTQSMGSVRKAIEEKLVAGK